MVHSSDIIIALIAILFPPAAVAILTGCSCDLLINIALTCLVRLSDVLSCVGSITDLLHRASSRMLFLV
jgi:uncharacterized membrane protein YqaE (UPF0057 family)